jgi:hypothetical protein
MCRGGRCGFEHRGGCSILVCLFLIHTEKRSRRALMPSPVVMRRPRDRCCIVGV